VNTADPLLPKPGVKVPVRVCDWYAWKVSCLDGAPNFQLYWPESKRDLAIQDQLAFLNRWGDRFRYSELQASLANFPGNDSARMTFAKLDHPATREDVKANVAIFSLQGEGEVRVVPLSPFPTNAVWKNYKDYPINQTETDEKTGKKTTETTYQNAGFIWQAEEVLHSGKWERYYGFVGTHIIAKVPAGEIEIVKDR
jgi:hypothetical protein